MGSLRDAVHGNPTCADALVAKDCDALANIMNAYAPRTKPSSATIGNGTVLSLLGVDEGNRFLDAINENIAFRYVKPLLDQGRLEIGAALVQATIQSLAPSAITQVNADRLCAVGTEPWPYTAAEMHAELFNPDGSEK